MSAFSAPSHWPPIARYTCGPVGLELEFEDPVLGDALHGLLAQYDAPWPAPALTLRVNVRNGARPSTIPEPRGDYLRLQHLRVDRHGARFCSTGSAGVWLEFDLTEKRALLLVPAHVDWPALVEEVEQQLILVLARAWAHEGWTPVHAGSLAPPGQPRCLLVCAPSGSGKTTVTAALLRRGWRTLGDDKTLLRRDGSSIHAFGLARRFHLDPAAARWFPETGDLSAWPRYSRWTDKRIVRIEEIWPDRFLDRATPTAVLQLHRSDAGLPFTLERLSPLDALDILLRQVAIPTDAEHARPLLACVAALTRPARAAKLTIGHNAFSHTETAERLDAELRSLLA